MADNTELNAGSGGDVFRADDNAGVKTAVSKIELGADGSFDGFVCATNPMPVAFNTAKNGSGTVYVPIVDSDGHLQVDVLSSALPTGAATAANQSTANTALSAIQTAAQLIDDAIYTSGTGTTAKVAVIGGDDGTNPRVISVNTSGHVAIHDGGNAITVDGTVTVNAGTNLNTSALALESGGNLAGAATSLAVIDDWDESDRAKVNIIVGQAGITAGAGAVGASTPRVTLASDDPAVALLGTIDTDTGNIATAVQVLDNIVYVDDGSWTNDASSHALVGGLYQSTPQTVTDGRVAPIQIDANGNVKVNVAAGSAAGTEYATDSAANGSEQGPFILGLRRDADTSPVSTDGDRHPLVFDANGYLKVEIFDGGGSHTVDNNGTFAVQVSSALPAGTNAIGKLAANDGVDIGDTTLNNTWAGNTGTGTESGCLRVTIATDSTGVISIDDNGSSITVDGTVTVNNGGTFAVQVDGAALTALQLIDDAVATTGSAVTAKGMLACGTDGTNARGLKTDSSGELQVDVLTQPVRDRLTDNVGVALQTDVLLNDTTALTPKFVIIDAASSGDNTILAAVTSKKIRVLSAFMVAAGAVNVRFESGAGGTALTGQMNLAANGGFVLPFNPLGWFETASNTLLNLELSGAVSVDGCLTYVEV